MAKAYEYRSFRSRLTKTCEMTREYVDICESGLKYRKDWPTQARNQGRDQGALPPWKNVLDIV